MKRLSFVLAVLLVCGNAFAQDALPSLDLHDSDAAFEQYKASQQSGYAAANAAYRRAVEAAPGDLALAVAQCRFIENFEYAEDIDWSDDAQKDLEACREALFDRAGQAPEVRVYQLETLDYDDVRDQGEALWTAAKPWPPALRRDIAARLAFAFEDEDEDKAGRYAVIATELGHAHLLAQAVNHLVGQGKRARASALAASSPPAPSSWHAKKRIEALIALDDPVAVRRELDRALRAGLEVSTTTRIDAYLAGKDLKAANAAAKELGDASHDDDTRFQLALANANLAQARSLVRFGDEFDTWVERYAQVVSRAPGQAFLLPLLPFTLALLLIVLATALIPGFLLVPVHYRGLVRRLSHRQPPPLFDGIGLRHAWIAGGLILIIPALAMFVLRPDAIGTLFTGAESTADSQFSVAALGSLLTLLALAPFFGRLTHSWDVEREVFRLRTFAIITGCWLAIFAVGYASHWVHQALIGGDSSTLQTRTVEALVTDGAEEWGMLATWLMMAVLTPVVEEVVFRGMLLGGMARHISFGWANTLQALLFASVHVDPPRFLAYALMGWFGGWLTRRYRSLLPAIALHALNNTIATILHNL